VPAGYALVPGVTTVNQNSGESNSMNKTGNAKYTGSCLCGLVVYEVDAIEPRMAHCHCSMCRKFHGSAYATFGKAKSQNFRWVSGEEYLKTSV